MEESHLIEGACNDERNGRKWSVHWGTSIFALSANAELCSLK
jgi:hypothetical protein